MRSWPLKFRLMSFLITTGVTLTEFAIVAAPIGFIMWLLNIADGQRIVVVALIMAAAFSLSISVSTHLLPRRYRTIIRGVQ